MEEEGQVEEVEMQVVAAAVEEEVVAAEAAEAAEVVEGLAKTMPTTPTPKGSPPVETRSPPSQQS